MDITQETITLLELRLQSIRRQVGPLRRFRAGRNCQKGYNCGGSCITRRKNCRKALEGEAKNFNDYLLQKMGASEAPTTPAAPTAPEPKPEPEPKNTDPKIESAPLTKSEKDAINTYTSRDYTEINGGLRSGKLNKKHKKTVEELDKAIAKGRTTQDAELAAVDRVFRGASIPAVNEAMKNGTLVGTEFTDAAYVSTTTDTGVAQNFQRSDDSRLYEIKVPKNTPALSTAGESAYGGAESEVLLGRNTKFRVTGVEKRKEKYKARGPGGKLVNRTKTVEYIQMEIVQE